MLDGDAARRVLAVLAGDAGHRGDDATAQFTAQFVARATAGVRKLRETLADAAGFVARATAKVEAQPARAARDAGARGEEGGDAKAKIDEQVAQMRVLQEKDGAAIEKLRADMLAQLDAAEAKGGEAAAALLARAPGRWSRRARARATRAGTAGRVLADLMGLLRPGLREVTCAPRIKTPRFRKGAEVRLAVLYSTTERETGRALHARDPAAAQLP